MANQSPLIPLNDSALIEAAEQAAEYFSDVFDKTFATSDDPHTAAEMNAVLTKLEAAVDQAKSTSGPTLFGHLPFISQLVDDSPQPQIFDVAVWRSATNICDQAGRGQCDTAGGLYYGTSDSREGKFCPRHYYEMHFGKGRSYQLLEQTVEEYEAALADKQAKENE